MEKFTTRFSTIRSNIDTALKNTGIVAGNRKTNPNSVPDVLTTGFNASLVTIHKETGKDGTRKRFTSTDLAFDIFLIVDAASDIPDPDLALYTLKESFRDQYQTLIKKDFPEIEYYNSYVDSSHPVRIAKLTTQTEKT
jgi:hypothetical protein